MPSDVLLMSQTLVMRALGAAQVEQRMVNGLLALVAAERGGETVARSLLANLLRCFISLGTYLTAFQVALRANLPNSCFWVGGLSSSVQQWQ